MTRSFSPGPGAAGERLDVFLASQLATNRSRAQKLIRQGDARVNDRPQKSGYLLHEKDKITLDGTTGTPPPAPVPKLEIIYEDADLMVVDKPAGLVVHSGAGTQGLSTVADFARTKSTDPDPERPGIVHRLDKDTSGLLIIAKSPKAKNFLQRQFSTRKVQKTYIALVTGHPSPLDALIRLPIGRDPLYPTRRKVTATGRPSETRYRTLANLGQYSFLEAKPLTGRTHQLRVHFAGVGHAVAGDIVYGPPKRPLGLSRQFLHAARLQFEGPSGDIIDVSSPLPSDLLEVVHALGGSGIIGE